MGVIVVGIVMFGVVLGVGIGNGLVIFKMFEGMVC